MKKIAILVLVLFAVASCEKECGKNNLSECLEEKVEIYKSNAAENPCAGYNIKEYLFEGSLVYVFGSPACLADGVDFVLNTQCDTICNLGGFPGNSNCSGKVFYNTAVFKRDIWKP